MPFKKFQVLAGKLQHASYGIPGGAGLFSPIDMAATQAKDDMVIITEHLKAMLLDWHALVNSFKQPPLQFNFYLQTGQTT